MGSSQRCLCLLDIFSRIFFNRLTQTQSLQIHCSVSIHQLVISSLNHVLLSCGHTSNIFLFFQQIKIENLKPGTSIFKMFQMLHRRLFFNVLQSVCQIALFEAVPYGHGLHEDGLFRRVIFSDFGLVLLKGLRTSSYGILANFYVL